MAETTYTYSIANDFPATGLDSGRMVRDIQISAIVTALERIDTSGDVCDIVFKDALSAGDKTILDGDTTNPAGGLIAAHTGIPVGDSATPITTEVTAPDGTPVVTDRTLLLGRKSLKRTDNGTEQMAIDGSTTGTPVVLWNGTGAGDTGGDWTAGSTGSETAGSMHAGTNGWDTGVAALNDMTVFNNGSLVDIDGTYTLLQFWMQPKAYPVSSNLRLRWVDASNVQVGGQVNINDYVSNMDLDVWQLVSIPIEDWNLDANVQKLQFRYRAAAGQHFYYDDIELLPPGDGPYKFRIRPPVGQNYHLSMLVLQVTAPESGWNNDSFGNISGGLANGLICRQRRLSDGETLWRFVTKDNREMFGQYHPQESFAFSDSTLLIGFMVKPGKATVVLTNDEILEFAVRDDLSSLTDMRAYLHFGVEEIV